MGGILSEGMKFNGCKKTCDPCCNEKDIKYCGNRIDCLDIDRGDSSNEVFNKLGNAICKNIQDIEILKDRTDIEVSENADCENGGIVIKDKNIIDPITDDYKVIYETCFPCCGSDDCKEYGFPTPNGTDNFWHIENLNDDDNFTTSTSVNNLYNNGISLRVNNFNLNAPLEYVIPNFASNITPLVSGVDYLINIGNVNVNFPQDGIVLFSVSLGDGVNASAKTLVTGSNVSFVLKAEAGVNYSQNDLIIKVNSPFLSLIESDAVLEIQNISVSSVECSDNNCKDCVKYPINKPNSSNNTWNNIDGVNSTSMTIGYENLLNITGEELNNGFNTKVTGFKDNNGDLIANEGNYCFEAFVYMKTTVETNTCFTVQFGDGVGATIMSFCKDSGIVIDEDTRLYHIKQNIKAVSGVSTSKDEMLITMTNLMSENIPVDFLIYNFTLDPIDCCCGSDDDCACLPEPPSDGGTYGVNNGEWVEVESSDLYVSIDPVNIYPTFTELYGVTQGFDVNVSGGVAPYTYKWTMQQSGGNFLRLEDDTQQYPFIGSAPNGSDTLITSTVNTHNNTIPLSYFSGGLGILPFMGVNNNYAGTVSVIHLKLVVTDSKGNKAKDYWTVYGYNTY